MQPKKEIYLAGGCFWGVESYVKNIFGVLETETGYANGTTENPTYEEVCFSYTGHAEAVKVVYDPSVITLRYLLELFFKIIDPTTENRQGYDVGEQYRTGIYYTDTADKAIISLVTDEIRAAYRDPTVTENLPLDNYYTAEDYHQRYLDANPTGYCHIDYQTIIDVKQYIVDPYFYEFDREKAESVLTESEKYIAFSCGTEPPFQNAYDDYFEKGLYVDKTSGEPLFLSADKFDAGCGWPAFSKPIAPDVVRYLEDDSFHMHRVEVRSRVSDIHLGHVFDDGPPEMGGRRFCINSAVLDFIPLNEMSDAGYAKFTKFIT